MRVHVAWPIVIALIAAACLASLVYQRSWIPDYAEAEPLYPKVAEFGRALAESKSGDSWTASTIKTLILEERFNSIQPYGVVFSDDPETIVSIRVNKTFSFDIGPDGAPRWNKNQMHNKP
jgi:hypothetical protein